MPALTKAARGEAEATDRQRRGGAGVGTARPGWPAATASGRRGVATASGRRGVATASGLEGAAGDGVGSRAADGVGVGSGARATATAAGQPGGVDRARGVVGRGDTGDGNQKISKVLLI